MTENKRKLTLAEKRARASEKKEEKKTRRLSPETSTAPQAEINLLLEFYQSGRYSAAETLAKSITKRYPNNKTSWKMLGAVSLQVGEKLQAVHANQRALKLSPEDVDAHSNLGSALYELGRLAEAEKSYRLAIELKNDIPSLHYNLGSTLRELGKLEEAEVCLRQAIELSSSYAEAHNNLGLTLKELGREEEAVASYTRAAELNTSDAEPLNNLGVSLKKLRRYEEAEASFRRAIALRQEYAEAHFNLGVMLQKLSRLEASATSYRKAIALKPDYAEAMMNLAYVLDYTHGLDEEICLLENLIKSDPDDFGLRAAVNLAILKFLDNDILGCKKYLSASSKIEDKHSSEYRNEKIYRFYLSKILKSREVYPADDDDNGNRKNLHVIGESHSLTSHQLVIQASGNEYLCKSSLIQNCRQWELGRADINPFKVKFESIFNLLPSASQVLLAIGEIDCRIDGGILRHKAKNKEKDLSELILSTVENYLIYVANINSYRRHRIIIQGVPCPNIKTENYSKDEIATLVGMIKEFNVELENQSANMGFDFLDLHKLTDRGDGFSNGRWHIDSFHISPAGMQEAWLTHVDK
ncbi:MAG: tetratricopeptide repeat protein [Gammaproteobacteria bacterium]|nr:tetratricopeptide repeat protein [Gammaproteobacteria bacterium]